jgi:NADH-quinone oxidoreductase subunit H
MDVVLPALIKVAAVIGIAMGIAPLLTWLERRQSAFSQDRLGPNRANIGPYRVLGLLHPVADGLKMISKEDFLPRHGDLLLHAVAPVMAIFAAFAVWAVIPFGPYAGPWLGHLVVADLNVGMLAFFALVSLGAYGAALAGWAGYNKFGLIGGVRATAQMVSYEVVLGLTVIGIFMHFGSIRPVELVELQSWNPLHWGAVVQPIGLVLFLTAAIAETKRAPFDIPEGESEIIGYFVECSALRFGVFYLSEFIGIIVVSALTTVLFFGGYYLPFLAQDGLHLPIVGHLAFQIPQILWVLLGVGIFLAKVMFFCLLQIQIRWTLPRFRYDQLMDRCWRTLLPLALVNIVVTGVALLVGDGPYGIAVWVGVLELSGLVAYIWPRSPRSRAEPAHAH